MESKIVLPAITIFLALICGSANALKCYECKSVGSANDDCTGEMMKTDAHMPIECNIHSMTAWYNKVNGDPVLNKISKVFEVDSPHPARQDTQSPMACVKMNLRVDNQPVILRTCQTAKTDNVDPCKTTKDKIAKHYAGTTVEYCGMCETDKCNGSYVLSPTIILSIVPLLGSLLMSLLYNSA